MTLSPSATNTATGRAHDHADEYMRRDDRAVADAMKLRFYPLVPAHAEGTRITDVDGNEYLDFVASAGAVQTGYRHPDVRRAILAALDTIWTGMPICYPSAAPVELAERLCSLLPGTFEKKTWFGATGSDANDCVSRLAPMASGRRRLVSYIGGYHGQTTGSALLSGHQTTAAVMGLGNITKVPYPDPYRCLWGPCSRDGCSLKCLQYVEQYALASVSPAADTAAIFIEAVQSDSGEIVPPENYLPALRELCDRHGIWLVFDEVKIGLGRTGRMFGFEHSGVAADAVTLGKPLGGGLPLSAVVGRRELLDVPAYTLYSQGGSPVACAAALATLDVLQAERLAENAANQGRRLLDGLRALQATHPLIGDVRGRGLILGTELVSDRAERTPAAKDTARLAYRCFELGLIVIYAGLYANVIEMTPPLTISEPDVDEALALFEHALSDVESGRFDDAKLAAFAGW